MPLEKIVKYITQFIGMVSLVIIVNSCSNVVIENIPVNYPVEKSKHKNTLSFLTFNVQAIFGKDSSKLEGLANYVSEQKIDFVTLQELFDENARDYFQSLNKNYYASVVPVVNYTSFPEIIYQDAGLYMQSTYPQINLDSVEFNDGIKHSYGAVHKVLNKEFSISTDFLANKSVMGSLHAIDDSTRLFLFTAHLQAIGSGFQKRTQLRQIKRFIEASVYTVLRNQLVNKPENLVVILTGDFNADAYNGSHVEMLDKYLGHPRDLHKELHEDSQEFTMKIPFINRAIRFDYIFAYDSVGSLNLRNIKVDAANVTEIVGIDKKNISDHFALLAVIEF